jgi:hypothetical protein
MVNKIKKGDLFYTVGNPTDNEMIMVSAEEALDMGYADDEIYYELQYTGRKVKLDQNPKFVDAAKS